MLTEMEEEPGAVPPSPEREALTAPEKVTCAPPRLEPETVAVTVTVCPTSTVVEEAETLMEAAFAVCGRIAVQRHRHTSTARMRGKIRFLLPNISFTLQNQLSVEIKINVHGIEDVGFAVLVEVAGFDLSAFQR